MRILRALVFCILSFLVFSVLGATASKLLGAAENQGLAAAAIVIGYGVMVGFVAVVIALVLLRHLSASAVIKLNFILGGVVAVMAGLLTYRSIQLKEERKEEAKQLTLPVKPTHHKLQRGEEDAPGMGFFKPDFYNKKVLRFYPEPEEGKILSEHQAYDSLVFAHNEMDQYEIAYAPPYLVPAHLKMDYDILFFRVKRLSDDFVEIEVNETTGRTAIVDRFSGKVIFWPEFILNLHSVEFPEGRRPVFRIKPLEHASEITADGTYSFLRPESVQGYWLEVSLLDKKLESTGRGWIKWRDERLILIEYSLLS